MDVEREIKRLKRQVTCLCALLFIAALFGGGWLALSRALDSQHQLKVARIGNGLGLSANDDGPNVVTHIAVRGWYSEGEKRVAALDPPLAIIDSHGAEIEDIRKLKWANILGKPADPPGPETKITALYFRPNWAEPRER